MMPLLPCAGAHWFTLIGSRRQIVAGSGLGFDG